MRLIVLDFESVNGMDSSSQNVLKQRINYYNKRNIKIYFSNVKGPVQRYHDRFGILSNSDSDYFFMSIAGAVDFYETGEKGIKDDLLPYISQANKYKV